MLRKYSCSYTSNHVDNLTTTLKIKNHKNIKNFFNYVLSKNKDIINFM